MNDRSNNEASELIRLAVECGAVPFGYGVVFREGEELLRFKKRILGTVRYPTDKAGGKRTVRI